MVGAPFQLKAEAGAQAERTFIMIKPDGVQVYYTQVDNTCKINLLQRGLVGEIVKRFEQKGFKLVAIRSVANSFAFPSRSNHPLFDQDDETWRGSSQGTLCRSGS